MDKTFDPILEIINPKEEFIWFERIIGSKVEGKAIWGEERKHLINREFHRIVSKVKYLTKIKSSLKRRGGEGRVDSLDR